MKLSHLSAALAAAALLAGAPRYQLRIEQGAVAAFDLADGTRLPLSGVPAASLRECDRAMLENGLSFGTFSELTRACEDLCS